MSWKEWLIASAFLAVAATVVVTVIVVLHREIHRPGSVPAPKRSLSFCYPNQGTGGC